MYPCQCDGFQMELSNGVLLEQVAAFLRFHCSAERNVSTTCIVTFPNPFSSPAMCTMYTIECRLHTAATYVHCVLM